MSELYFLIEFFSTNILIFLLSQDNLGGKNCIILYTV